MSRTVGGVEPTPASMLRGDKGPAVSTLTVVWVVLMALGLVKMIPVGSPPASKPSVESQVADLADRVRSLESEVQALTPPRSLIRIAGD